MSRAAAFTQLDIERAVRGAINGGLQPGSFEIRVSKLGSLRILPASAVPSNDMDEIDEEIAALLNDKR